MAKRLIWWVPISRRIVGVIVLSFGFLGLVLSLQQISPALTVTGGRVGTIVRMLLDMMEFSQLGI